jgi:hypothetical protein
MPSGGMWVVEPSHEVMARIENLYSNPVPGTKDEVWRTSDLGECGNKHMSPRHSHVVPRAAFCPVHVCHCTVH